MLSPDCPVFQLQNLSDKSVNETADITFVTWDAPECLFACLNIDICEAAEYDTLERKCHLFTTRGEENLTLINRTGADVFYKECRGTFQIYQ